jgi:hypothetical protein
MEALHKSIFAQATFPQGLKPSLFLLHLRHDKSRALTLLATLFAFFRKQFSRALTQSWTYAEIPYNYR